MLLVRSKLDLASPAQSAIHAEFRQNHQLEQKPDPNNSDYPKQLLHILIPPESLMHHYPVALPLNALPSRVGTRFPYLGGSSLRDAPEHISWNFRPSVSGRFPTIMSGALQGGTATRVADPGHGVHFIDLLHRQNG